MSPGGGAAGRAPKHCWLSRALYRCKHLPLAHVVPGERRAVLRNLLLAWAPFDQAEYRVAWQGDSALAVAWDRVAIEGLLAAAAMPRSTALWPETFLREPPGKAGLRVVQCLEGFEAQVWRDRSLLASRWWPEQPDSAEVEVWLRSLGADVATVAPVTDAEAVAWRRRPWAELQGLDGLLSTSSRVERVAIGALLAGLSALTAAQAHLTVAAYQERQALQLEYERLQIDAAPVAAARDRAESLAREAENLATQLTGVLPLEVLQHLDDVLPRGVILRELDLTGMQLRLAIELAADVQRGAVVKDLQSGGWLSKVNESSVTSNRGWIVFDAVLLGERVPVTYVRPARTAIAPAASLASPVQLTGAESIATPADRSAAQPSGAGARVPRP